MIANDDLTPLRIEKSVYGGDGLARTAAGEVVFVPFTLPGELVQLGSPRLSANPRLASLPPASVRIFDPAPERVEPACVHFGVCGGCQFQMAHYPAQLSIKHTVLKETLGRAGVNPPTVATQTGALRGVTSGLPEIHTLPSPEPYGYRNRIRLRVRRVQDALRLGYSVRGTNEFLPITMCPIAAPLLWRAAEAFTAQAERRGDLAAWLEAAAEVELFCNGDESRLHLTLLCTGKASSSPESFTSSMEALRASLPELNGAGAVRIDPRSGRQTESYAAWGAAGLPYRVTDETHWITRGGFFQVNRFLLPELVALVCGDRWGALAWDLFAGVGLFSRVLARHFGAVTAVEASPVASSDLARALAKLGPRHRAVHATTIDFLRRAVLERDRPDLVVLDPPRAGAGEEVCRLLVRLAPREIVYLSCDPTTLARDLSVLTASGYSVNALHLIDLFPQTYHLETLAVLHRA